MNLFVSDLDGTLLTTNGTLSETTRSTLKKLISSGVLFTVATARQTASVTEIIDELGIELPIITSNGAFVYDPQLKTNIVTNKIYRAVALYTVEIMLEAGLNPMIHAIDKDGHDRVFYLGAVNRCEHHFFSAQEKRNNGRYVKVDGFNYDLFDNVVNINVIDTRENLKPIADRLNMSDEIKTHFYSDVYVDDFYWLEASSLSSGKGSGLRLLKRYVQDKYKVSDLKTIVFGDNDNDVDMFLSADESYSVGNGSKNARRYATGIIGNSCDDAVANFMNEKKYMEGYVPTIPEFSFFKKDYFKKARF